MRLNVIKDGFTIDEVYSINHYTLIDISNDHYIGSYLSTGDLSPIQGRGIIYDVWDTINYTGKGEDDPNFLYRSVPTGTSGKGVTNEKPKGFRFNNYLIYENIDFEESLTLYDINDTPLCEVLELTLSDKLIVINNDKFYYQDYHLNGRYKHRQGKHYLTQEMLNSYDPMFNIDKLGNRLPNYEEVSGSSHIFKISKDAITDAVVQYTPNGSTFDISVKYLRNRFNQPNTFNI